VLLDRVDNAFDDVPCLELLDVTTGEKLVHSDSSF
jgi:hypothetical protein